MVTTSHPPAARDPARGLRRLARALDTALADRRLRRSGARCFTYVDFSELYAYAFRTDREQPNEDFLGGREMDESTAAWMLALATHHLFNGWGGGTLRMLPPHRSEMASELRRLQNDVRVFQRTRAQVLQALPPELRTQLDGGSSARQHVALLQVIRQGHLSTLCMQLLEKQRDVTSAQRCQNIIRKLLEEKRLELADASEVSDYQPGFGDLAPVEEVFARVRRAQRSTNATDARALLYLRESVTVAPERVRFTTRSGAVRRALRELVRSDADSQRWKQVQNCLRVPETILLDFLAGDSDDGTEWLERLERLLHHFLAEVDRAHERLRQAELDRELIDTTQRAWQSLVEALNLRRSTRADAPELLRAGAAQLSQPGSDFLRLAGILLSPEFHADTDNQINVLLASIELAQQKIAVDAGLDEGAGTDVVPLTSAGESAAPTGSAVENRR